ncbi:MAG: hypothetical protein Q4D29_12835 [Lachnospiraceae bacterium]|nr:hypothetical protein [Lachnospiraceae bacterium]
MKFNANELLDSFNRELNQMEINELYKALIAYNLGLAEITDEINEKLEKVLDFYYERDDIMSFINEDVLFYAGETFDEELVD